MKLAVRDYLVPEGAKVRLRKWPTRVAPVYRSNDDYAELLARQVAKLRRLQEILYASNQCALLVIFQGMDTSGKDGAIAHVMTGVNPQGCQVVSFKHPSATELEHDFLWRTTRELPERGNIGIFNRSYYEEVLVVRVHPGLLRAEGLPDARLADGKVWEARYRSILGLEDHLARNGTHVVKFFLHLSKDEQKKRLLERIDDRDKNWKCNPADIEERRFWDDYMKAYEDCLGATSTRHAPWYVVPADDKHNARIIVAHVITRTLEKLDLRYSRVDAARRRELQSMRAALAA